MRAKKKGQRSMQGSKVDVEWFASLSYPYHSMWHSLSIVLPSCSSHPPALHQPVDVACVSWWGSWTIPTGAFEARPPGRWPGPTEARRRAS